MNVAPISDESPGEDNCCHFIIMRQQELLERYIVERDPEIEIIKKVINDLHTDIIDVDLNGDYCSACLAFVPLNSFLYNPCKCSYFKIHKTCLPKGTYICRRCNVFYGRGIVYSSILRFIFVGRCRAALKRNTAGISTTYRCSNFTFRSRFCNKHVS